MMKAKYVNLFTDFGFKKIFGEEASKPFLIDFLNSLLPESQIVDLTFKDKEKFGQSEGDRKAVYDIYCQNSVGEHIIVELQKAKQNYFKDRTIYYSSFPIQEQAQKGNWNYELKSVYCVGILDFKFEEDHPKTEDVIHTVQLKNQHNQVFYDKLKFVYLEMPHFNKTENELATRLDKWLYFIKHTEDFQTIPDIFKDAIFEQAFEKAAIANYSEQERNQYAYSLKVFRDNKNTFDYAVETAFDEGRIEGEKRGEKQKAIEIAQKMKLKGFSKKDIQDVSGLSDKDLHNI